jgi:hypothetical protein
MPVIGVEKFKRTKCVVKTVMRNITMHPYFFLLIYYFFTKDRDIYVHTIQYMYEVQWSSFSGWEHEI